MDTDERIMLTLLLLIVGALACGLLYLIGLVVYGALQSTKGTVITIGIAVAIALAWKASGIIGPHLED